MRALPFAAAAALVRALPVAVAAVLVRALPVAVVVRRVLSVAVALPAAVAAVIVLALPAPANAQTTRETTLLQDDLAKNQRTRIDAPKDSFDSDLDAALGGPQGFSTKALETIEDRLKQELRRDRPRATPRLIVFLYPGRIDAERLRSLAEVNVDIELVMDPCDRNVCKEAVAKHLELVGRAVGQPVIANANFKMIFQMLTLKTSTTMHDDEVSVYRVPIAECVKAAQRPGGGLAWLDAQQHATEDYEPIVIKAIARHAAERRVSLESPPSVKRGAGGVDVTLAVRGDRSRTQQQTIDALAAAAAGLRDNPTTPQQQSLEIDVDTGARDGRRRFRSMGSPVALYVDGRLSGGDLWGTYVSEIKKGQQTLSFGDDEASGRAPVAEGGDANAPDPDDNEVVALLSQNFSALGGCARDEAQRNPRFRGITLTFQWTGQGHALGADVKEAQYRGSPVAKCLVGALGGIRLPRQNSSPRTIEFPIRVR